MKNLKHTQGNWEVSKHGNNDSFGIYAEGSGNDLAIIRGGNEEGGEAEANSKLIAAAPDLLAALMKISNELRDGNYKGNHVNGMVQMAEEAIRKAIN
jgi:hypothetical protein